MTSPQELMREIQRIHITTRRAVMGLFAGQYHSVFKGQGIEFDEIREYQSGDDVRFIDWNVTARYQRPFVKRFIEERELTVMFLVDVSASMHLGSFKGTKLKRAAEVMALLGLSAHYNHDKVGSILFTDRVTGIIPPRRGLNHVLTQLRAVLAAELRPDPTCLWPALQTLHRIVRRQCVVFILSDFFETTPHPDADDLTPVTQTGLAAAARRHDVIAVAVHDPLEHPTHWRAPMRLQWAETQRRARTGWMRAEAVDAVPSWVRTLQRKGLSVLSLRVDEPIQKPFIQFFRQRRQHMRYHW